MKKAFTLIELVFVILILGIIGALGISSMKRDIAAQDGNFLLLKIKESRYKAIGYEGNKNESCINIDKDSINNSEKASPSPYTIRSSITINPSLATDNRLCFDSLGRPHDGEAYSGDEIKLNNLMQERLTVELTNGGDKCSIKIHPLSGYAIIVCK